MYIIIKMELYKIEFLANELRKHNINNLLINKLNDEYYQIIIYYNNNYIVIENKDSASNYDQNIEKNELTQIVQLLRNTKNMKRKYDDIDDNIHTIKQNNINDIYIIRINFNGYMTKKKKRYPNIFKLINNEIDINYSEWNWRFDLLKKLLNQITNDIDKKISSEQTYQNYYVKLFFRHFSMDDMCIYNTI